MTMGADTTGLCGLIFFSHKCETPEKFLKKLVALKRVWSDTLFKVSKVLRCVTLNLLKFQQLLF